MRSVRQRDTPSGAAWAVKRVTSTMILIAFQNGLRVVPLLPTLPMSLLPSLARRLSRSMCIRSACVGRPHPQVNAAVATTQRSRKFTKPQLFATEAPTPFCRSGSGLIFRFDIECCKLCLGDTPHSSAPFVPDGTSRCHSSPTTFDGRCFVSPQPTCNRSTGHKLNAKGCICKLQGSARLSKVQQSSARLSKAQQGSARLSKVQQGPSRLSKAQQGSAKLSKAQQGSARSSKVQQGSAKLSQAQQDSARLSKVQQGSTRLSKAQQGSARLSKAQQGSARLNKAQQGSSRSSKAQQGSARLSKTQQGSARSSKAQQGSARLSKAQQGPARVSKGSARLSEVQQGPARLSKAQQGPARVSKGSARLSKAQQKAARLSKVQQGSARLSKALPVTPCQTKSNRTNAKHRPAMSYQTKSRPRHARCLRPRQAITN